MTCSDDAPHSQGCPCWNAKVREDAYAECIRAIDVACLEDLDVAPQEVIRAIATRRRLEAGEAELRDK